jgi:hypothetical protein
MKGYFSEYDSLGYKDHKRYIIDLDEIIEEQEFVMQILDRFI